MSAPGRLASSTASSASLDGADGTTRAVPRRDRHAAASPACTRRRRRGRRAGTSTASELVAGTTLYLPIRSTALFSAATMPRSRRRAWTRGLARCATSARVADGAARVLLDPPASWVGRREATSPRRASVARRRDCWRPSGVLASRRAPSFLPSRARAVSPAPRDDVEHTSWRLPRRRRSALGEAAGHDQSLLDGLRRRGRRRRSSMSRARSSSFRAVAYEFKLPDLGEGLTEGEVARWLVAEGQEIAEDDPLVEIRPTRRRSRSRRRPPASSRGSSSPRATSSRSARCSS